jgi:hypothetical protein
MSAEKQDDGTVVMFATRAPGQVAAQPDPSGAVVVRGAASGNPKFDPVTGRFAGGQGKAAPKDDGATGNSKVVRQTAAGNIDPVAAQRRRDLVRTAANLESEMTMTDASKWLEEFGVDTSVARVDAFLGDVRQQRIDYLVETMVPNLRATVDARKAGQVVKLKAPKSWSSSVLRSLTDAELLQLHQRLVGQGFDPKDVTDNLIKGMGNKKRKEQLQQVFGETPGTQGQGG